MEQKLNVYVAGRSLPYIVEPRGGSDLGTQAREILANGTTVPILEEEGAFLVLPARVIERVEIRKIAEPPDLRGEARGGWAPSPSKIE